MQYLRKLANWLENHPGLAGWAQAAGVVFGIIFALVQVNQATDSLKATVQNNEIALRNSASDLLVGINEAALDNPDAGGEFVGHKRLHLMRLHYFYRTFQLRESNLIDDDSFEAETNYLQWTTTLPDFIDVWDVFRMQYSSGFRRWVDAAIKPAKEDNAQQDGGGQPAPRPVSK